MVGEVTNVQPFLTFSRASLYMESTIRVLDIIKSRAEAPVKNSLAVLCRGGIARLESGRVIAWDVHGEGDHYHPGQQHLFFLVYREEPDAYLVQQAWRVQDGLIKAVYPGDQAKASQFLSDSDGRVLTEVVRALKARTEK